MENQKKSHEPATIPLNGSVSVNEDGTISSRTKLTVTVLENDEIVLNVKPATDLWLLNDFDTENNVEKSNKKEKKKKSSLFDCIKPHTDSDRNKNVNDIKVLKLFWDFDKKPVDTQKTTKRLNLPCVPSCEEICCKDESSMKKLPLEVIDAKPHTNSNLNKNENYINVMKVSWDSDKKPVDTQKTTNRSNLVCVPSCEGICSKDESPVKNPPWEVMDAPWMHNGAPLKKKSEPIEVKEKYEIGSKKSEEISGNATESNRVELFYNDEMKDLENMFVQYKNEIQEFDPFAISEKDISKLYIFIDEITKEPKINCNLQSQVEIVLVDKDT